jgi:hypothetical protein
MNTTISHGQLDGAMAVVKVSGSVRSPHALVIRASANLTRIDEAGPEQIRFGWAGSLERQRPQYYRLQGPTFLLEYDNTRGGGTHIHSVWRDFERDFGYHLL